MSDLLGKTAGKVVCGGDLDRDDLYIGPTVVDEVKEDDELMKDEVSTIQLLFHYRSTGR